MGSIASIHLKKTNAIQTEHNDRKKPPSYLIGENFEVNRSSEEAQKLKEQIVNNAKETYRKVINQPFKSSSYEWSAVVNLTEHHTMADLEKLSDFLCEKYGFQCYQIAIHRDEGHYDDDNQLRINHHAHLEFITLDKKTGKNRQRDLKPRVLREMQTEVAEILGMRRGIDKRISGVKRIEPRVYASLKEKERRERVDGLKLTSKDRERIWKSLQDMMNKANEGKDGKEEEDLLDGYISVILVGIKFRACDFRAVKNITKNKSFNSETEIYQEFIHYATECGIRDTEISQEITQELQNSSQTISNLENENNELKNELGTLKTTNNELRSEINTLRINNQTQETQENNKLKDLEEENEDLKKKNQILKEENSFLKRVLEKCYKFFRWLGLKTEEKKILPIEVEFVNDNLNVVDEELWKDSKYVIHSYIKKHQTFKDLSRNGETVTLPPQPPLTTRSMDSDDLILLEQIKKQRQRERGGGRGRGR